MVQYLSKLLKTFKRDERGGFSILLVAIFTTMILVAGAAVDLVRFEAVRSSIQYNLDRAVLAAASIRQTQSPADVVNDYMSRVDTLSSFNVAMDAANTSVSATGRKVSANATATLNTYFLKIAGITTMDVEVNSKASEIIPNLEISLVLDVSGSMEDPATGGGTKISKLRTAANQFIDTMVANAPAGSISSISIVPYSSNVALPQNMWDLYSTEGLHTHRTCALFDETTYGTNAVSTSTTLRQLSYYKTESINFGVGGTTVASNYDWCNPNTYSEVYPFSTDATALKARINNMVAIGGTATHIGTKWGVALLDPAAQVVATSIGSSNAAGFPNAYTSPDVAKVLVVMTDGKNSDHRVIEDGYRAGPSDMWFVKDVLTTSTSASCYYSWMVRYYIRYGYYSSYCWTSTSSTTSDEYFIYNPDTSRYYQVGNRQAGDSDSYSTLPGNPSALPGTSGYQEQLTWPEVWEEIAVNDYAYEIYESQWDYLVKDQDNAEADALMLQSCTAAKNRGISVYTIAFEAPASAEATLQSCATTASSHYFDVSGADISSAFASIALSIQKLKLTQ